MTETNRMNFDEMNADELRDIQERAEKALHGRTKKERAEKRKQLKDLAKELGYTVEAIPNPGKGKGRGRPKKNPQ